MNRQKKLQAWLVDDEELALQRLARLLNETGQVEILGQTTNPEEALRLLADNRPELLFLDIQMPVINGFELLRRLDWQPQVIFTTAFDKYALRAFEVNSIDYLLKPIEKDQLQRALSKFSTLAQRHQEEDVSGMRAAIRQLADSMSRPQPAFPTRIASRTGERIRFLRLAQITHFFAQDKLTYAATAEGVFVVDRTITDLENELDPEKFLRIHRSALLNLEYVDEFHAWFGGRIVIRLADAKKTELTVARERVGEVKKRLGL